MIKTSYKKCEWCGEYLRDFTSKCPFCGALNSNKDAEEELLLHIMNKDELILRIMNVAGDFNKSYNLKKMTRKNLVALYKEMKKDKKRCE